MKKINFLLREMTHLRYYVPLIKAAKERDISSTFFIVNSGKYNCTSKHPSVIDQICKDYDVKKYSGYLADMNGVLVLSENSGLDYAKAAVNTKKLILTYQTDFINCYESYKDVADYIAMPSRPVADFYKLHSEKNIYAGIPKYDVEIDRESVMQKYGLPSNKKFALFMYPKKRDENLELIRLNFDALQKMGYTMLIKTRGKDRLMGNAQQIIKQTGHFYFEDDSWFPHTTQELLAVSDIAINFGSTAIEECVMHEVPVLNYDIKPQMRHGVVQKHRVTYEFLYDYDYCENLDKNQSLTLRSGQLTSIIWNLLARKDEKSFKECKKQWLFDHKNTCNNILDVIESDLYE